MSGQVSIVGAGCGGPELITVRGLELLQRCEVVIYDDLIAGELLDAVPETAERIPVGKRAGSRSPKQEYINELLIQKAGEGKRVVRLKGGDPFVFGRGGEESLALAGAGVPYTLVPGISSALAIPMEFGIPVTHRTVSRSVHIVTAHTAERALPENIPQLAALEGTLVFLMGLRSLKELAQELIAAGKSPDTPTAVLSGGNSPHPRAVRGTLASIAERTEKAGVLPPAVIVVGEVAQMDLRSPGPSIAVGLTGTEEFQQKLAALLDRHGLNRRQVQRGKCSPTEAPIPWKELSKTAGNWIVFTSGRGVDFFFRRLAQEKGDVRSLSRCLFAVIGEKTAEALAAHGIRADLCPGVFTGKALAQALLRRLAPEETVYLFDSVKGSRVIPETLAEQGISCRRISLYDTIYETVPQTERLQYILFGSAGGVNALADDGYEWDGDTIPICIGPVCARAFENRFHQRPVVSPNITAESMVETLLTHSSSKI